MSPSALLLAVGATLLGTGQYTGEEASARWAELAERCGSEIEWLDWKAAARRAEDEGKLVFVQVCVRAHYDVPESAVPRWRILRTSIFADRDLVALLTRRFVSSCIVSEDALDALPFRLTLADRTLASDGVVMVAARPDGTVLLHTAQYDAGRLTAALADADRRHGEKGRASGDAEQALLRGDLETADALLQRPRSTQEWRLRAALERRRERGAEALAALERAEREAVAAQRSDVAIDRALVLIRLGRFEDAELALAGTADRAHARRAEASFLLGAARFGRHDAAGAARAWMEAVEGAEADPFVWRAAANLSGLGSFTLDMERLEFPPAPIESASPLAAPERAPDVSDAVDGALQVLLATQRADGSWGAPEEATLAAPGLTEAVTAIAARSVIPHRVRPEVRSAIERAWAYLARSLEAGKLTAAESPLYNARIWARTFVLRLIAELHAADLVEATELGAPARALSRALERSVQPSGAWDYFAPGLDSAVTFSSAPAILALLEARRLGIAPDAEALSKATSFLRSVRTADGGFPYLKGLPTSPAEAAGRSPLCALALHRAGPADHAGLRQALALFREHRHLLEQQLRVTEAHLGPDGQAGYYYLFDHYFAALAARELPLPESEPFLELIREATLRSRLADGSFVDCPAVGRSYGSAMALLILAETDPEPGGAAKPGR